MKLLIGFPLYGLGMICIALGIIWFARRKARVFYGVKTEGLSAQIIGGLLIIIGISLIAFAYFVLPNLLPQDIFEI